MKYFYLNFEHLGVKKLISTHYDENKPTYKLEYGYDKDGQLLLNQTDLTENGDFRSNESIRLLKEADIVITNPPFSLFREFISQMMAYNKKFLIIGSQNAVKYKEIFPLLKDNKIWLGFYSGNMAFRVPNREEYKRNNRFWIDEEGNYWRSMGNICWFTNLEHSKRNEELILWKTYNPEEYPNYDNYRAIEVSKVKDIPIDYDGVMGVPITFANSYNPNQFEILGMMNTGEENKGIRYEGSPHGRPLVNGKELYTRFLIRRKL